MKPAIFLCVGAMKSGTTWLYEVLRRHPECALAPVKELHFFEAKYAPQPDHHEYYLRHFDRLEHLAARLAGDVRQRLARRAWQDGLFEDRFLAGLSLDERVAELAAAAELLALRDFDSYVAYFEALRSRAGAKIAGEMTATYADLPGAAFREIAGRIPGVKLVYVMRDPVERFWSHARFEVGREGGRALDLTRIEPLLEDPFLLPRSDYKGVIEKLEAAVDPRQIHYAFYERLVARGTVVAEMHALERFLGLAPSDAAALRAAPDERENVSPTVALRAEDRRRVQRALAPVYEFIARKFGALPPGWHPGG